MKIKVELEIELEENMWPMDNPQGVVWFTSAVMNPEMLSLQSKEVGDEVGKVLSAKCTLLETISATISPNGVLDKG